MADVPNLARGDCLFEAVIYNINHRFAEKEKLLKNVQHYREEWCAELMLLYGDTAHYPGFQHKEDWYAAWDRQLDPGQFNVDEYSVSDLVPAGLGHCVSKDILVFNVGQNSSISPVNVYPANIFNSVPTSQIPILIVYDGNHYESLLPVSQTDIDRSIQLVNFIKNGTYNKQISTGYLHVTANEPKQKSLQNKIQENLHHIERNITEVTCDLHEKTFQQPDEPQQHMGKHDICDIGNERYTDEETLNENKQNNHITCPAEACEEAFESEEGLQTHMMNTKHSGHACKDCNKYFARKPIVKYHLLSKHGSPQRYILCTNSLH